MESFLVSVLALLRPSSFIHVNSSIAGLNLFEFGALSLSGLLLLALSMRATLHRDLVVSAVDVAVIVFCAWCILVSLIYVNQADPRIVLKLILPPLTYSIAKNVIRDEGAFRVVVLFLLVGFLPPMLLSVSQIALGKGLEVISYWTGEPRYSGVYAGAHNMAHNSAFLLMLIPMYVTLVHGDGRQAANRVSIGGKVILGVLIAAALICLYAARVRTPLLGLLVFGALYLYAHSRKMLVLGVVGLTVTGVALAPVLVPRFFYDAALVEQGRWDVTELGSNRPNIWAESVGTFLSLPPDQKVAGAGIGVAVGAARIRPGDEGNLGGAHNDYLEILIQTGIVGLLLYLAIQVLMLRAVVRMPSRPRAVFLGLFVAVTVMNVVSNSYVSRVGLGQMFYLIMAFAELAKPKTRALNNRPIGPSLG